jgi:hypothetical protein
LREFFDDWLVRAGTLLLILIAAMVAFNNFSDLPREHPLLGVFSYGAVIGLWIAGAAVFFLTILKRA